MKPSTPYPLSLMSTCPGLGSRVVYGPHTPTPALSEFLLLQTPASELAPIFIISYTGSHSDVQEPWLIPLSKKSHVVLPLWKQNYFAYLFKSSFHLTSKISLILDVKLQWWPS